MIFTECKKVLFLYVKGQFKPIICHLIFNNHLLIIVIYIEDI